MDRVAITDMKGLNNKNSRHLCGWWLLAALGCGVAGTSRADTVVVTADRMIDVIAGKVIEHPQITIIDSRISAVGTQGGAVPCAKLCPLP
jgi:hypothetical protein